VGSITRIANGRVRKVRSASRPSCSEDRRHHVRRVCLDGEAEI
jgi:hypothetical protein